MFGSKLEDAPHRIILSTEDELDLLCKRIRVIVIAPIPFSHLEGILATSAVLIPQEGSATAADLKTKASRTRASVRVLQEILSSVCSQAAYDTKTGYSLRNWIFILDRIYKLSTSLPSRPRPSYLNILVERAASAQLPERVSYYRMLRQCDFDVFKSVYTEEIDYALRRSLTDEIEECVAAYHDLPDHCSDDNELEAYSRWILDAKGILEVADEYFIFGSHELTDIDDLQSGLEIIEERVSDYQRETSEPPEEEYEEDEDWTISQIFEDL